MNAKWHLDNYQRIHKVNFWYSEIIKRVVSTSDYYMFDQNREIRPTPLLKKYAAKIILKCWKKYIYRKQFNFVRYKLFDLVLTELYYYPGIGMGYFNALRSFEERCVLPKEDNNYQSV